VDRPEPRPVEVLVRVHAAGVNPADWEARADGWGGAVPPIPGFDVSGVVEAVGFRRGTSSTSRRAPTTSRRRPFPKPR
jgi:NADPH:quinone reductase-like Zn-dependent oxidoreductase